MESTDFWQAALIDGLPDRFTQNAIHGLDTYVCTDSKEINSL